MRPLLFIDCWLQVFRTGNFDATELLVVILLGLLLYSVIVGVMLGRKKTGTHTAPSTVDVTQLSPAELRFIRQKGCDARLLVTMIVSLACKGYLTIRDEENRFFVSRVPGKDSKTLSHDEQDMLNTLFSADNNEAIATDTHAPRFRTALETLEASLGNRLQPQTSSDAARHTLTWVVFVLLSFTLVLCLYFIEYFHATPQSASDRADMTHPILMFLFFGSLLWSYKALKERTKKMAGVFIGATSFQLFYGVFVWWTYHTNHDPIPFLITIVTAFLLGCFELLMRLSNRQTGVDAIMLQQVNAYRMSLGKQGKSSLLSPGNPLARGIDGLPFALALDLEGTWAKQYLRRHTSSSKASAVPWFTTVPSQTIPPQSLVERMAYSFTDAINIGLDRWSDD